MKRLLILSLLIVFGCEMGPLYETKLGGRTVFVPKREYNQIQYRRERLPMLKDGRIHIGMTQREFAKLWDRPKRAIDRSTSRYGVTEWWWFNYHCEPSSPGRGVYAFCFDNGILDYWSEN